MKRNSEAHPISKVNYWKKFSLQKNQLQMNNNNIKNDEKMILNKLKTFNKRLWWISWMGKWVYVNNYKDI